MPWGASKFTDNVPFQGRIIESFIIGIWIYFKIRKTYFLTVVCPDEATIRIDGEAALEGLNSDGDWIGIIDVLTVEKYWKRFLQSPGL